MFRPLLCLVDFDGVINVLQPGPVQGHVQAELDGYRLQASMVSSAGLDLVLRGQNLKPVWASMWGHRAPEAGRRLGIGAEWPSMSFDYTDPDGARGAFFTDGLDGAAELKFPIILRYIGNEPVVWIDDDITPRLERWAVRRDRTIPTLVLVPNPRIGLTMLHLEDMIRFAHRVQAWREERGSSTTSPTAA
jgi:hypothetical protein